MKSKPLSPLTVGLLLIPMTLVFLVDIAKMAFPSLDPIGFYIAILLGSGMMYGMVLERHLLNHFREIETANRECESTNAA
jgi:hypothetical protein